MLALHVLLLPLYNTFLPCWRAVSFPESASEGPKDEQAPKALITGEQCRVSQFLDPPQKDYREVCIRGTKSLLN